MEYSQRDSDSATIRTLGSALHSYVGQFHAIFSAMEDEDFGLVMSLEVSVTESSSAVVHGKTSHLFL